MAVKDEQRQIRYETRIGVNRGTSKPAEAEATVSDAYGDLFNNASRFAYNRAIENGKLQAIEKSESYSFTTEDVDLGNGNTAKMPVKYTPRTDLGRTGNIEYANLMNAKYRKSLNNSIENIILEERTQATTLEISKPAFEKKLRSKLSMVFESLDPDDRQNAKLYAEEKIVENGFYVDKAHRQSQLVQDKLTYSRNITNIYTEAYTRYYATKDTNRLNQDIKEILQEKELYKTRIPKSDLDNIYDSRVNRLLARKNVYDSLGIDMAEMNEIDNLSNTNNQTMQKIANWFNGNGVGNLEIGSKKITKEQLLKGIDGDKDKIFKEIGTEYVAFAKTYAEKYKAGIGFVKVKTSIRDNQRSDLSSDKIQAVLSNPEFLEGVYEEYAMKKGLTESFKQAQSSGSINDFYGYLYSNPNIHALPPTLVSNIKGAAQSRNVDRLMGYSKLLKYMSDNSQYMKENGFDNDTSDLIKELGQVSDLTPDNYRIVMDRYDSIRNDKELSDIYQMGLKSIFDKTQNIGGDFQGVADFNKYMDQQVNDLRGVGDIDSTEVERFGYMAAYKVKKAVMDRIMKSNKFPTKNRVQEYIYEEAQALVSERKIGKSVLGFSPLAMSGAYIQDTDSIMRASTFMENSPELVHSEAFSDGGLLVMGIINSKINQMKKTINDLGGNNLVSDLSETKNLPNNSKYKLYPLENEDGTYDYQIVHIGRNTFDPVLLRDEAGDPLVITVEEFGQIADKLNNE